MTAARRSTMTHSNNNGNFDRMTFEGMIQNSHQVLDLALSARDENTVDVIRPTLAERAIPPVLFEKCHGILLLHVVEAAFVVGASLGTGLLMAHNPETNTWSAPSATGLTGIGWGVIGGIARKDLCIFIMDHETMTALTGNVSLNLGGHASLTLGETGREFDATLHASNRGVGATVAFSYSRGFLVGMSLEGSVVAPRTACNNIFYKRPVNPSQVLYEMEIPESVKELHNKLQTLAEPKKRIREPIRYQAAQTQTGRDESYKGEMVLPPMEKKRSDTNKTVSHQVAQTQTDEEKEEELVTCQVAQTQTGEEVLMEGENVMESPLVEVKRKHECVANQTTQTQTDEQVVVCQGVKIQTGMDGEVMTDIPVAKKTSNNDVSIENETIETQTEEEIVSCHVVQTQTGVDGQVVMESTIEKIMSNDISIAYETVETQTEEQVVVCQGVQTQTGGDCEAMVESSAIEKKTSNDISIAYQATEEQVVKCQGVQTQTGDDNGIVMVESPAIEKKTSNNISITYDSIETQTDTSDLDAVRVSDDDDDDGFVITDCDMSSDEDEMEFVVMDASTEIEKEMKATGM